MRYLNIENIVYTDQDGKRFVIKDKRIIPEYNIVATIEKDANELLDEIAIRSEIYGDGNESLTYRIFEANQRELLEVDFDLTKIKELKIPVTE